MNTTEANKLIVEFMGGKYVGKIKSGGFLYDEYDLPKSFPCINQEPDMFGMKRTGWLGFNTSWDWLMPVVIKIRDMKIDDFTKKKPLMQSVARLEFDNIWKDTVTFIKWYNSLTAPAGSGE